MPGSQCVCKLYPMFWCFSDQFWPIQTSSNVIQNQFWPIQINCIILIVKQQINSILETKTTTDSQSVLLSVHIEHLSELLASNIKFNFKRWVLKFIFARFSLKFGYWLWIIGSQKILSEKFRTWSGGQFKFSARFPLNAYKVYSTY